MLAIVCKTYEGVESLEKYDGKGSINGNSGLHGLGSSIGKTIAGRFMVICLEDLRQEPVLQCIILCLNMEKVSLTKYNFG